MKSETKSADGKTQKGKKIGLEEHRVTDCFVLPQCWNNSITPFQPLLASPFALQACPDPCWDPQAATAATAAHSFFDITNSVAATTSQQAALQGDGGSKLVEQSQAKWEKEGRRQRQGQFILAAATKPKGAPTNPCHRLRWPQNSHPIRWAFFAFFLYSYLGSFRHGVQPEGDDPTTCKWKTFDFQPRRDVGGITQGDARQAAEGLECSKTNIEQGARLRDKDQERPRTISKLEPGPEAIDENACASSQLTSTSCNAGYGAFAQDPSQTWRQPTIAQSQKCTGQQAIDSGERASQKGPQGHQGTGTEGYDQKDMTGPTVSVTSFEQEDKALIISEDEIQEVVDLENQEDAALL